MTKTMRYAHWCGPTHGHDMLTTPDGEFVLWTAYDVLERENAALKETQLESVLELQALRAEVAELKHDLERAIDNHNADLNAAEPTPECICPTCGLRHGGAVVDGGF